MFVQKCLSLGIYNEIENNLHFSTYKMYTSHILIKHEYNIFQK